MPVTRKAGISGKICTECGVWKPLIDFPPDRSPGRFKGYRKSCCSACQSAMKGKK